MSEEDKEYVPILPFDVSFGYNLKVYDEMPYVRDANLCNPEKVAMESGNVYKFYRCNVGKRKPVGGDRTADEEPEE